MNYSVVETSATSRKSAENGIFLTRSFIPVALTEAGGGVARKAEKQINLNPINGGCGKDREK